MSVWLHSVIYNSVDISDFISYFHSQVASMFCWDHFSSQEGNQVKWISPFNQKLKPFCFSKYFIKKMLWISLNLLEAASGLWHIFPFQKYSQMVYNCKVPVKAHSVTESIISLLSHRPPLREKSICPLLLALIASPHFSFAFLSHRFIQGHIYSGYSVSNLCSVS